MANLASSKKRIRQDERKRMRNRSRKTALKTESRKFLEAIHDGNLDSAKEQFQQITKHLDQVSAKSAMHKRTAARKKSRFARRLNAALAAK